MRRALALLVVLVVTAVIAPPASAGPTPSRALSKVAGVPVWCVDGLVRDEGFWGAATESGLWLDARRVCARLEARERNRAEVLAWVTLGHEIAHARGIAAEDCAEMFGVTHAALFAKRAGASNSYRAWLRGRVRQYVAVLAEYGIATCSARSSARSA